MASLVALILVTLACIQAARGDTPRVDGYPRPKNFPDAPTVAYGVHPATRYSTGGYGACDWYGWANVNYPADVGAQCLPYVWKRRILPILVLTLNFGSLPNAYEYYYCSITNTTAVCYDTVKNEFICTIGCFDLFKTGLRLPPVTDPQAPPGPPGSNAKSDAGAFQKPSVLLLGWAVAGAAAAVVNQLRGARQDRTTVGYKQLQCRDTSSFPWVQTNRNVTRGTCSEK